MAGGARPIETRLTEAQLRDLTSSLPHLVWTCLAEGPCDYLSQQLVDYTGIPESAQLDYGWLEQLHPEDRERVKGEWSSTVGHGVPFDIEFRIRRSDGEHRWFRTRAIPLRSAHGQIVKWYGSNTDIDDYRRTEESLRISQERLRQAHQGLERIVEERTAQLSIANRELEAFSYSVAHDLRAPLRGMNGFAEILLKEYGTKLDAEACDCLRMIQKNAVTMGELIDALLSLARVSRTALHQASVDISALARSLQGDLKRAYGLAPELVVQEGLHAYLDPALARVLLENLLSNAWKFSANASSPRVEVGECAGALFVRDNGAGFNMAHAQKLFTPFQRLHAAHEYPGTGIGLATAHRIVDRHGGRIWAESQVGSGATFFFELPNARSEA